jgi:hypothetical protein
MRRSVEITSLFPSLYYSSLLHYFVLQYILDPTVFPREREREQVCVAEGAKELGLRAGASADMSSSNDVEEGAPLLSGDAQNTTDLA